MIIEFNDTPEGMVVDIEVIAGIPSKGYDERNPIDGFTAAAGMNEVLTAPLLAANKNSMDWEESINAITRHAIEEFSNLQFFVPTLWQKCTLLGAKGINWIPTLGNWMQHNNKTSLDAQTVSFYHALSALAQKQIDISNTPHGQLVKTGVSAAKQMYEHATNAAETVVETKSKMTYVPISNALTAAAYEANKANGAQPGQDIGLNTVVNAVKSTTAGISSSASSAATVSKPSTRISIKFNGLNITTSRSGSSSSSTASAGKGGNWFTNIFSGHSRA